MPLRWLLIVPLAAAIACSPDERDERAHPARSEAPASEYREPSAAVVGLLTAAPPPEPIIHARTGRVALLFREPVIRLERLSRPRLGLAGFRFDPRTRTSGAEPLVTHVEVIDAGDPGRAPLVWRPSGALLDHVRFSPDGRTLSALAVSDAGAQLALFEIETRRERLLATPVNPAWGDPCVWSSPDSLLCRVVPAPRGDPPPENTAPTVIDHDGGPAPLRTYSNLLENAYEDALFEYYFGSEIARVDLSGDAERIPGLAGLISYVEPSPDGSFAVVKRTLAPFSRLVPARSFPSSVEIWDLARGERLYASRPVGVGADAEEGPREDPRRAEWKPGASATIGYIETTRDAEGLRTDCWWEVAAPFRGEPRQVACVPGGIADFGWTTAGTPWFTTSSADDSEVRIHAVFEAGPREIWHGSATDHYGNPGRVIRVGGSDGPMLERDGHIFIAGDGLAPDGPHPYLVSFDLRARRVETLFRAEPGVYEVVLAMLDGDAPAFVTSRETESEPPNLFLVRGASRTALRPFATPYPALANVTRGAITYQRADGVPLSGTLYLPAGRQEGERLPTLIWIYPYEFSDREYAEQIDVRLFRFHRVTGPSPLAAVLEGYAVLVNPTVPILHTEGAVSDDYLEQLVASAEAAVDHLVSIGVADPARVAVGGRSYGAFSSANLMIHSRRFATAIVMSGAYNRTLTPFGFQHERRSFWSATDLYAAISPFFHADRIESPILLVHGGSDENPGTPTLQAQRFFHALVGEGVRARYVELPYEGHHYWARENVLQAAAEMIDWLRGTL